MPIDAQQRAANRFVLACAIQGRLIPVNQVDRNAPSIGAYLAGRIDEYARCGKPEADQVCHKYSANAAHHWAMGLTDEQATLELEQMGNIEGGLWREDEEKFDAYTYEQEKIVRGVDGVDIAGD